ncbi:MAG: ParB/RepB/Spo0J family partition protein [Thermus sp.]|uniref:ParB/RepB/Spo0J family partition protein n=1 Tax=Thermus sp. TaxID=275 RepID=UPI003919A8D5
MEAKLLPLELLVPRKDQPRKVIPPGEVQRLMESIQALGMLEPIVVRPLPDGRYEIISGERRYRAAKALKMGQVPVVIKEVEDEDLIRAMSLAENTARADLTLGEIVLAVRDAYRDVSDEEFWEEMSQARSVVLGKHQGNIPKRLLRVCMDTGLSTATVVTYLHYVFGYPRPVLEMLARAGIGVSEAKRLKRRPELLKKFLEQVERFRASPPVQSLGLFPERLAWNEVFGVKEKKVRKSRVQSVADRMQALVDALYDMEEDEFAERLEGILEEYKAAKGLGG